MAARDLTEPPTDNYAATLDELKREVRLRRSTTAEVAARVVNTGLSTMYRNIGQVNNPSPIGRGLGKRKPPRETEITPLTTQQLNS